MDWTPASFIRRWFDPQYGASDRLVPRWIFLRALGLIYFSAFFSLIFQIRGLVGPDGILPAGEYLDAVARQFAQARFCQHDGLARVAIHILEHVTQRL